MNPKEIKEGQWLFTCSMLPQQFKQWKLIDPKTWFDTLSLDYARFEKSSEEEKNNFLYDGFETLNGSYHSKSNCSLKPISETYALWFIENKCNELFPDDETSEQWEIYENKVKELCLKDGIEYEGI